eukprot:m.109820 g.109820  ORF g.109820 m.109820 type:complete len:604 (+) comp12740_c0_seq2:13-1824(+)
MTVTVRRRGSGEDDEEEDEEGVVVGDGVEDNDDDDDDEQEDENQGEEVREEEVMGKEDHSVVDVVIENEIYDVDEMNEKKETLKKQKKKRKKNNKKKSNNREKKTKLNKLKNSNSELEQPLIAKAQDEQTLFDVNTNTINTVNNINSEDPISAEGYQTQTQHVTQKKAGVRSSTVCGYLWIVTIVLILCGFVPWGAIELHKHGEELHVIAWFVSGIFVSLAIPMTLWDVAMHLRNWHNPRLQRHIIRILFMVPIYAIDSWFALRFPEVNIYFDVARETYEAYVIYNFYVYLLQFLRQRQDFDIVIHHRPNQPHKFPFCCLKEWRMGQPFINACTNGVTSYVVVRILSTIIAFCTELAGKYGDGDITFDKSWIYIVIMNSISQLWAMYCLILFYYGFKEDLKSIKPFQKFLTIKAIIFLSFWQAVVIALLVELGAIKTKASWSYYSSETVAAGLQDFLICIEMFIAAVVHRSVFSYKEHLPDDSTLVPAQNLSFGGALKQLLDVRDVAYTVLDHVQTVYTIDGKLMEKRAMDRDGEHTALLTNNFVNKNGSHLSPEVPYALRQDQDSSTPAHTNTPPTTTTTTTTTSATTGSTSYGSIERKTDV